MSRVALPPFTRLHLWVHISFPKQWLHEAHRAVPGHPPLSRRTCQRKPSFKELLELNDAPETHGVFSPLGAGAFSAGDHRGAPVGTTVTATQSAEEQEKNVNGFCGLFGVLNTEHQIGVDDVFLQCGRSTEVDAKSQPTAFFNASNHFCLFVGHNNQKQL